MNWQQNSDNAGLDQPSTLHEGSAESSAPATPAPTHPAPTPAPNSPTPTPTPAPAPTREVLLIDTRQRWMRNPADMFGAVMGLVGIAVVALVAVYGKTTTVAVTEDVRLVTGGVLETILALPINALEGLMSFFLPFILLGEMVFHRRWRTLVTAVVASAAAVSVSWLVVWMGSKWWPQSLLFDELSGSFQRQSVLAALPYVAMLATLLTVSSSTKGSRIARVGWWLLGIVLVLSILQGNQSLPGALFTILIGVIAGLLTRYIVGGTPERTTGAAFIAMIRKSGIDVVNAVRVDELTADDLLYAFNVTTSAPLGHTNLTSLEPLRKILESSPSDTTGTRSLINEINSLFPHDDERELSGLDVYSFREELRKRYPTTMPSAVSRNYLATDIYGHTYHLMVLDNDRQILSFLDDFWARLTMRTAIRQTRRTLDATAEHMVLVQTRAEQVGVSPPAFVTVARQDASVLVAEQATEDPLLADVDPACISDAQLDALWHEVSLAHRNGISHGNMYAKHIKVTPTGLHVANWQHGSILASETSRQVDMAQTVAMLAGVVGVERAVDSATRNLSDTVVASIAPFLQATILPHATQNVLKKADLQALRDALAAKIPEASNLQTVEFTRFSLKTIATVAVGVIALLILFGSLNFEDLRAAILDANPWWMLVAFLFGLGTYIGAALTLKAFSKEDLPLGQTLLVQVAASVVTLVAPAGIGPAALNLRFLQKKGVQTAPAVATVSVVQLGQFVVTIALLIVLSLFTGDFGNLSLPSGTIQITLALIVTIAALAFGLPKLRRWVLAKIRPTLNQVWPRVVWLFTHPTRILAGAAGSVFMSVAFIACFGFALKSFGYELPLITLAVTYLISNSVGSVVPSPGGIGPVEAALTGGLAIAGIPSSIAFSTAVLYRLFTFWGRVPLGWVALQIAQKRNIV
ncbi:lysylphosphatidylglycerol synthase transmembrane domain-containing protein [Trueperella pecoris]|uniref:Flippase-like domain-containing protein n=1 Tax=Trueperella pecoris TaxID=2733571 RepID=A0A7M1QVF8_9ACTO|nr:lysylphosphatidylglycerol synthase transmembrane domain-containing protein [Trueperella pecoris]QOQ39583.1 flippase-like domain-containing protein [Trueperella pecoris]QOR45791.1 flippase-like domain-containing protein [Trueperella pecoris]